MTRTLVILSVVKTASEKKSRAPKRVRTFPWEISPEVNLIARGKRDHHYCLPKLFHQVEPAILEKKIFHEISGRQFAQIHYDQAQEQSNKTIKYIKGPIDFVNWASDELQSRWEIAGTKITKF